MKRVSLAVIVTLCVAISPVTARAGGGHGGGGWHGGGCWGGGRGWCGGGYWGGGRGWWGGGYWPSFSFGVGFGGYYASPGYYPGYYYGYPAYGYAYGPVVYSQPIYAYRVAQPYSPTAATAATPTSTIRAGASLPVYTYSKPAPVSVVQNPHTPTRQQPVVAAPLVPTAPVVTAATPVKGHWVLDPTPYSYTPPTGGGASPYVVAR